MFDVFTLSVRSVILDSSDSVELGLVSDPFAHWTLCSLSDSWLPSTSQFE